MKAAPASVVRLEVNGRVHHLPVARDTPLLNLLRNDLRLNGPKYGCGLGECGACLVLIDDRAARACVIPAGGVEGRRITTLEGLGGASEIGDGDGHSDSDGDGSSPPTPRPPLLHPVQQAFIDCQAAQCGYCLNGMIVATVDLLRRRNRPTDAEVRAALSHNLCRCGTHLEILQAVQRAADLMAAAAGRRRGRR